MASLLNPLQWKGWVKNYLDDLTVFVPTFSELLSYFEELFALLTDNGVKLNWSKCAFGLKKVTFLGHCISAEGSKPDPKNVEAVIKMKALANTREMCRFLGMCGFYRKHQGKKMNR